MSDDAPHTLRESIEGCLWIGFIMALMMSGPVIGTIYLLHVITGDSIIKTTAWLAVAEVALGAVFVVIRLLPRS